MIAQDWSRTSTRLLSLAPQASASAYSATWALTTYIVPAIAGNSYYLLLLIICQFSISGLLKLSLLSRVFVICFLKVHPLCMTI